MIVVLRDDWSLELQSPTERNKVLPMLTALRNLTLCLSVALLNFAHAAQSTSCPQVSAVVTGAAPQDFADVCDGAAKAVEFLTQHGLMQTEQIRIEVTKRLPEEAGPSAVGCYIEKKRTVYLVPYATFEAQRTWFGVRIDRAMYRAVASHEAAHAIAACNFRIPNPTIRAKEYLAYVVMWSTMPPALRQKALRQMQPVGFGSMDRFTPMLYLFDPMRYGAEAYRHFSASPDPLSLIQDILAGKELTD